MSEHKHGGDIYTNTYRLDFSTNLNPLGMPESVRAAACEGVRRSDCYPDVQCRELVRAIAQKERVPEEFVVCANGAAELIFSVVRALRPKKALLVSPGFAEYERALAAKDCEIVYYPLRAENGFLLGCDYLEYLQEDVELLFLCNPNNPTGVQIDRALLERILQVCKERGIRMVLDVCFLDFLDDPAQADFASQLKEYPQLFLLKAFTKTYAMAGLRLGYGQRGSVCGKSAQTGKRRAAPPKRTADGTGIYRIRRKSKLSVFPGRTGTRAKMQGPGDSDSGLQQLPGACRGRLPDRRAHPGRKRRIDPAACRDYAAGTGKRSAAVNGRETEVEQWRK